MTNKSKKILSEISAGELLDKISILEIKISKVKNEADLKEINKEYKILKEVESLHIIHTEEINKLFNEIKDVNITLWNIEDKIRICEKDKLFEKDFVELSRGVYKNNDRRASIKSEINKMLGSNIREIKQYSNY